MNIDLSKDKRFLEIKKLLGQLADEYRADKAEILGLAAEIKIPISVLNPKIGSFEAIVKYLAENRGMRISDIANLTKRSKQGVWQALNRGNKKYPGRFPDVFSDYDIRVSAIANKRYSVLESIVKFIRDEFGLSFAEISRLLSRDQRTIWTVYNRAKRK